MARKDPPLENILRDLKERTKELDCLYRVDEILHHTEDPLERMLGDVVAVLPLGWQFPADCVARITHHSLTVSTPDFVDSEWVQSAPLIVDGERTGRVEVFYRKAFASADEGPFLKEERKLINSLASRIGLAISAHNMRIAFTDLEQARQQTSPSGKGQWRIILEFLRRTDPSLLLRISRKLLNHLIRSGIPAAAELLLAMSRAPRVGSEDLDVDNRPVPAMSTEEIGRISEQSFTIAAQELSEEEILEQVQTWIREERARFLVSAVSASDSTLDEVCDAIRRFQQLPADHVKLPASARRGLPVSLIGHFFTDQPAFIAVAKKWLDIQDCHALVERLVFTPRSRGKLGGKAAGMFLAATILQKTDTEVELLRSVRVPRSWYITSDGILQFLGHNELEDVYNQKYAPIDQVRHEYPHIVQMFKNSRFPPRMQKGLSVLLDDLEGRPLIVRSSSLLEDRFDASFSGKYKSLFLANRGSKTKRLAALLDAVAEVYASVFGPDPIEYRAERGLLDVYEEMGILIQEVVGTQVGRWHLPAFSGVAFSRNEFRWSPRIRREHGLVRLVPGLGTRAVDRLKDDWPILLAPGLPGLRASVSLDEIVKYSPKKVDAINLETEAFETVDLTELLSEAASVYPQLANIVSVIEGDRVRRPLSRELEEDPGRLVVTFEGLASGTPFMARIRAMLGVLERELARPVDLEFASDGKDLYLLQCRVQSAGHAAAAPTLPRDVAPEHLLFNARRFVSNGLVSPVTHVVFVDPDRYLELSSLEELKDVGRIVGRLNQLLPKRRFVLMGPGRWGSRGDIKLGVNVGYADINNTAALIEIALRAGGYVPDLSFGTHFFQDLVEARIRYLPLYPDDAGIRFQWSFFRDSPSVLEDLVPTAAPLAQVVRVIDVPQVTGGLVLRLLMNGDLDEAVGILAPPAEVPREVARPAEAEAEEAPVESHWRWRLRFAERLAAELDGRHYGVRALYVFGSTKNASAGPASDIDLLVHFVGEEAQRRELECWFDGWSRCLEEINFLRTGYRTNRFLDAHLVTDRDIERRTSFAVKIGAVTDAARRLTLKSEA